MADLTIMDADRTSLHRLVDALSDDDVRAARQMLEGLIAGTDEAKVIERALEDVRAGRVIDATDAFAQWRRAAP